ncbi:MAG: hypothetical protein AABN95_16075 [Acidobacteriota bacterium]
MSKKDAKGDSGSHEVQEIVDAEEDKGHTGTVPDPTPNANYTVAGVTAGKPTPESPEPLEKK